MIAFLLAFVLGEVLAVLEVEIISALILMSGLCFIMKKTIVRCPCVMPAMVFLLMGAGFFIYRKEGKKAVAYWKLADENENAVVQIKGRVDKVVTTDYYKYLYMQGQGVVVVTEDNGENTDEEIIAGTTIKVSGLCKRFDSAVNEGNFDSEKYYMSTGIYAKIVVTDSGNIQIFKEPGFIRKKLAKLKKKFTEVIYNCVGSSSDKNNAMLLECILLGNKSSLSPDLKSIYVNNGIAHIFSISGLHISIIGMAVYRLFSKSLKPYKSGIIAFIFVVCYGCMIDAAVATIRAIIMFGVKMGSIIIGKNYDIMSSMSLAGIMLLFSNPMYLFNTGFQLSFLAVVAIGFVHPAMMRFFNMEKRHIVLEAFLCSCSINFTIQPVMVSSYYFISAYNTLLNIIVVPGMSVVMSSGFLGLFIGTLNSYAGKFAFMGAEAVLNLYSFLCNVCNKLPFHILIAGKPSILSVLLYYAGFIIYSGIIYFIGEHREKMLIMSEERSFFEKTDEDEGRIITFEKNQNTKFKKCLKRVASYLIIMSLFLCVLAVKGKDRESFSISILDVGQGDGIVISAADGCIIMVDGGSSDVDAGRYRIVPYLKAKGISTIDYSIITHLDDDHCNGVKYILDEGKNEGIKIKCIVLAECIKDTKEAAELEKLANVAGTKVIYVSMGDEIIVDKADIRFLYPLKETVVATDGTNIDANEYSLVFEVDYMNFSMLFTGDIGQEAEESFVDLLKENYTVLKVAHHGSRNSTSVEFLAKVLPKYAVISCGENNNYGHPHDETLMRLEDVGSTIVTTPEYGMITIEVGEKIQVKGFLNK